MDLNRNHPAWRLCKPWRPTFALRYSWMDAEAMLEQKSAKNYVVKNYAHRVCKDRAKEDRGPSPVHSAFAKTERRRTEGPAPSTVCLQRQTQREREREREREEQGPARSAQRDGMERAQGGRGLSLVFKSRTDVAEKASKGDRER